MGYAERAKARTQNGTPRPQDPASHVKWCATSADTAAACTCYTMPALKCAACNLVLEPRASEGPHRYAERVRAHALFHAPDAPGFIPGRVERRRRPAGGPEGTES